MGLQIDFGGGCGWYAHEEGSHNDIIKLADRQGAYQQAITIHERYSFRPESLEEMCLAQFSTLYVKASRVKKDTVFDDDGCSEEASQHKLYKDKNNENAKCLPKYIDLRAHKLGFMRIRAHPAILRTHSSKKKEGLEEFYAELLLYLLWRDEETDLKRDKCNELYNEKENREKILENKKGLFPQEKVVEMLENFDINGAKPAHIYDTLDPQMVQDDAGWFLDDPRCF